MSFDGRLLAGISVLAAVVQSRSFARAADSLGITASGVSRAVARLEERVGVRLLDRTTRSVALTDEGRRFYEQVGPLLSGIEDAATAASGSAGIVRGRLSVDIDPHFARMILSSHIGGKRSRCPAAKRYSVERPLPSAKPSSSRPFPNAATILMESVGDRVLRNPITGSADVWACAESGAKKGKTAAPPMPQ